MTSIWALLDVWLEYFVQQFNCMRSDAVRRPIYAACYVRSASQLVRVNTKVIVTCKSQLHVVDSVCNCSSIS